MPILSNRNQNIVDIAEQEQFEAQFQTVRKALLEYLKDLDELADYEDSFYTPLNVEVEVYLPAKEGKKYQHREIDFIDAFSEYINKNYSLLLLGEPGGGKSTSLRYLTKKLLEESVETGILAIYVNLRQWSQSIEHYNLSVEEGLLRFAKNYYKTRGEKCIGEFFDLYFDKLKSKGRIAIVMDSFDEIPILLDKDDTSDTVIKLSNQLEELSKLHIPFIISSRNFRRPRPQNLEFLEIELKPFSDERIEVAAKKRYDLPREVLIDFFGQGGPWLKQARNPFVSHLLFEHLKRNDGKKPKNLSDLYEGFIESRLLPYFEMRNSNRPLIEAQILIRSIQKIAQTMLENSEGGLEGSVKFVQKRHSDLDINKCIQILEEINIMKRGNNADIFTFVHRRFNEYFLALRWKEVNEIPDLSVIVCDKKERDALVIHTEVSGKIEQDRILGWCLGFLNNNGNYWTKAQNQNLWKENPVVADTLHPSISSSSLRSYQVGDKVKVGDILCIVRQDNFKWYIRSTCTGTITEVFPDGPIYENNILYVIHNSDQEVSIRANYDNIEYDLRIKAVNSNKVLLESKVCYLSIDICNEPVKECLFHVNEESWLSITEINSQKNASSTFSFNGKAKIVFKHKLVHNKEESTLPITKNITFPKDLTPVNCLISEGKIRINFKEDREPVIVSAELANDSENWSLDVKSYELFNALFLSYIDKYSYPRQGVACVPIGNASEHPKDKLLLESRVLRFLSDAFSRQPANLPAEARRVIEAYVKRNVLTHEIDLIRLKISLEQVSLLNQEQAGELICKISELDNPWLMRTALRSFRYVQSLSPKAKEVFNRWIDEMPRKIFLKKRIFLSSITQERMLLGFLGQKIKKRIRWEKQKPLFHILSFLICPWVLLIHVPTWLLVQLRVWLLRVLKRNNVYNMDTGLLYQPLRVDVCVVILISYFQFAYHAEANFSPNNTNHESDEKAIQESASRWRILIPWLSFLPKVDLVLSKEFSETTEATFQYLYRTGTDIQQMQASKQLSYIVNGTPIPDEKQTFKNVTYDTTIKCDINYDIVPMDIKMATTLKGELESLHVKDLKDYFPSRYIENDQMQLSLQHLKNICPPNNSVEKQCSLSFLDKNTFNVMKAFQQKRAGLVQIRLLETETSCKTLQNRIINTIKQNKKIDLLKKQQKQLVSKVRSEVVSRIENSKSIPELQQWHSTQDSYVAMGIKAEDDRQLPYLETVTWPKTESGKVICGNFTTYPALCSSAFKRSLAFGTHKIVKRDWVRQFEGLNNNIFSNSAQTWRYNRIVCVLLFIILLFSQLRTNTWNKRLGHGINTFLLPLLLKDTKIEYELEEAKNQLSVAFGVVVLINLLFIFPLLRKVLSGLFFHKTPLEYKLPVLFEVDLPHQPKGLLHSFSGKLSETIKSFFDLSDFVPSSKTLYLGWLIGVSLCFLWFYFIRKGIFWMLNDLKLAEVTIKRINTYVFSIIALTIICIFLDPNAAEELFVNLGQPIKINETFQYKNELGLLESVHFVALLAILPILSTIAKKISMNRESLLSIVITFALFIPFVSIGYNLYFEIKWGFITVYEIFSSLLKMPFYLPMGFDGFHHSSFASSRWLTILTILGVFPFALRDELYQGLKDLLKTLLSKLLSQKMSIKDLFAWGPPLKNFSPTKTLKEAQEKRKRKREVDIWWEKREKERKKEEVKKARQQIENIQKANPTTFETRKDIEEELQKRMHHPSKYLEYVKELKSHHLRNGTKPSGKWKNDKTPYYEQHSEASTLLAQMDMKWRGF